MSHFVVLVTNTDEESVESQLEPFYEQGNEKDYFMEKDYFIKNNQKSVDEWLDNELKQFDELLEKKDATPDAREWWEKGKKAIEKIKKIDNLKDQLKAIKSYEGCGQDKKGLFWVYNPKAKWDWYVIGGRWDKWLITRWGEGRNCCQVKDLDLDGMRINEMGEAAKYYVMERTKAKENNREMSIWGFDKLPTLDEYVESRNHIVAPFAILHDGEWIEKGEMGWFGMSDDKYSEDEWEKKFKEFIETLDPESEITIVDCHI